VKELSVFWRSFLSLLATLFFQGCESPRKEVAHPGLLSLKEKPVYLDVGSIDIVFPKQPSSPRDVGRDMKPKPAFIVEAWLRERFRAAGGPLTARFQVEKLALDELRPQHSGYRSSRSSYAGSIIILLEIVDQKQQVRARVKTETYYTAHQPKSLNLYERRFLWTQMVETMLNNLDRSILRTLRTKLQAFSSEKPSSFH
jgi:hypothetical protein